jgi:hypothetical protein
MCVQIKDLRERSAANPGSAVLRSAGILSAGSMPNQRRKWFGASALLFQIFLCVSALSALKAFFSLFLTPKSAL